MTAFPNRLIEARRMRGMTARDLARQSGYSPQVICHYEKGDNMPSGFALYCIAEALDVSADFLMGRSPVSKVARQ